MFYIDNLLVRILPFIEMIWWTDHAPWEFEFPYLCLNKYFLTMKAFQLPSFVLEFLLNRFL